MDRVSRVAFGADRRQLSQKKKTEQRYSTFTILDVKSPQLSAN